MSEYSIKSNISKCLKGHSLVTIKGKFGGWLKLMPTNDKPP